MIKTLAGFQAYLQDFDSGNFSEFVPKYYAENAIFEKQAIQFMELKTWQITLIMS